MTTLAQAEVKIPERSRDFTPGGLGFGEFITVLIMVATASPWFIVIRLLLHAGWDVLHHNGWDVVKTKIPQ